MMTALAFILGCVPLWTASGAGSVARQIMGTAVIGGMVAESFIGRFFVPAIFYFVERWSPADRARVHGARTAARCNRGGSTRCVTDIETNSSPKMGRSCWQRSCSPAVQVGPNYHRPAVQAANSLSRP